jgi:hypothetical protein
LRAQRVDVIKLRVNASAGPKPVTSAADHDIESSFLARNRLYRPAQHFLGAGIFLEAYAQDNGGLKADPSQLVYRLGERYEITLTNIK